MQLETTCSDTPTGTSLISLDTLGATIKAHIQKGNKASDKAEEHYKAAGIYLSQAKERVRLDNSQTWPVFLERHCQIGRRRADELIAIAEGRTSVAEVREGYKKANAKRNTRHVHAQSSEIDEQDQATFQSLVSKITGANRQLAQWLLDYPMYSASVVAGWLECSESRIQRLREWAAGGFFGPAPDDVEDIKRGLSGDNIREMVANNEEPTKAVVYRKIPGSRLSSFSGDNEWYTPAKYIELARQVLGDIDLDPASNAFAQKTVKAGKYFSIEKSGLDKPWIGKVWMNPPYSNPEIQQFSEKLLSEYQSKNVVSAIVLTNNSGDTAWHQSLAKASSARCITAGRIKFESQTRESNSPAMGQSFFYFGKSVDKFSDVFSAVGRIEENYTKPYAAVMPLNDNIPSSLLAAA